MENAVEKAAETVRAAADAVEREYIDLRTAMIRVLNGFPAAKTAVMEMFREMRRLNANPEWAGPGT